MQKEFITTSSKQTQKLGEMLARESKSGKIICLAGDLGTGKTTFTQGFLKGLKVKGPHTSPTFVIMKKYDRKMTNDKFPMTNKIQNIYHIDAYRVGVKDIISLGWEEIISNDRNIVIIEWADKIKKVVPSSALWIKFKWTDKNKRKIIF